MNSCIIDVLKMQKGDICFWGYNEHIIKEFEKQGIKVSKIFSSNKKLYEQNDYIDNSKNINKYKKSTLNDLIFFFPRKEEEILKYKDELLSLGFDEDIIFFLKPQKKTIIFEQTNEDQIYHDRYGNKITIKGMVQKQKIGKGKLKVSIIGWGNDLFINENVFIDEELNIILGSSGNTITIGKDCRFFGKNTIHFINTDGGNNIFINNTCKFTEFRSTHRNNTKLTIGSYSTVGKGSEFCLDDDAEVVIGNDCMISTGIIFQPCDGHSIIDLNSGNLINSPKLSDYALVIDDHVWIGRRAFILGKTHVREGSIIGAQSVVKGFFPNNVVIVGNPGRVVKRNVAWSRNSFAENLEQYNGFVKITEE